MRVSSLVILSLFVVSGCVGATPGAIDNKKFLETQEGPEVSGVKGTLERNADEAMERGDYARAVNYYQQLLDSERESINYRLKLADARRRSGDLDTALGLYETVLEKHPKNIDAREGKALALLSQGETDQAAALLTNIMESSKTRWRTLNALALLFVQRGMHEEAMAYFAEALKHSKNNTSVLNNVGLTQAIAGEPDKAIQALEEAARLALPKSPLKMQIELNLALVYGVSGNMDKAEKLAGQYLQGPALVNNLGLYAYLAKDEKLAKSYFNMALSSSPYYYPRAWDNLLKVDADSRPKQPPSAFSGKRVKVQ